MSTDPLEDTAIEAVRAGDANAYGYLVEKYMRRALSVAWGVVRNSAEAEDLVQDGFVRAYEKIDRFTPGEPFGPWLFRIVTNLGLDRLKHQRRFPTETLDTPGAERAVEGATEWSDAAKRIDSAIETLPEMQRIVARLYLVEEFEHAEIASMTGLSEGTIRSHLSHARKKLQEMLKDFREVHP